MEKGYRDPAKQVAEFMRDEIGRDGVFGELTWDELREVVGNGSRYAQYMDSVADQYAAGARVRNVQVIEASAPHVGFDPSKHRGEASFAALTAKDD